jgi:hypothetical protein
MKGLYERRFKYSLDYLVLGKPRRKERVINWLILALVALLGIVLSI